ncbi:site-specific integrase [Hoeflea sp. IMCC20628]|uniref:site-specific integrase n=1 Tax=Hoeflea sp. IMCC20628 TaxID=1620421 RepID=UPI0018CF0A42|nr:site-specific integrase [Hoeflea sp. IMCC20628]
MSQPSKDNRTGMYKFRKRVPQDLQPILKQKEIVKSLGTKDVSEARLLFARVAAEIEERFATLRAGITTLSEREASSMAGEIYRLKVAVNIDDPGKLSEPEVYRMLDAIEFKDHPDHSKTKLTYISKRTDITDRIVARRNDREIKAYMEEKGIRLHPDSMELVRSKVRKAVHRARTYLHDLSNDDANPNVDPYADFYPRAEAGSVVTAEEQKLTPTSAAPLLSEAIEGWATEKKTSWDGKSATANVLAAQRFLELARDRPLDQYNKKDARAYKNALKALPKNYTKHPDLKGCTFAEAAIKAAELSLPPMSDKNVNKNLGFVRAMWNWSDANFDDVPPNPFNGLNLRIKESGRDDRNPFTASELQAIFNAPLYTGCKSAKSWRTKGDHVPSDRGNYWVPLIGLFTGARSGEIIQMNVSDVATDGGIAYFKITDEGEEQGLKTKSSLREIPIHPKLLELGILDFASEQRSKGHTRLFPEMRKSDDGHYSSAYSRPFGHFLTSIAVKTGRNSFHSFRHNFEDAALDCLIPQDIVDALQGHSAAGMAKRYGTGLRKLRVLDEQMQKLRYEGLDLSHLPKLGA